MTITAPTPVTSTGVRVALDGETRTVETDDGVREVEARVCAYGVGPDTYNTTWRPGWAEEGLRESLGEARADGIVGAPITMVYGHDEKNISNVIGSVAGYRDAPDGLYLRMRMANFDEVPSARIAYSLIRDGHIRGWSFKYRDANLAPDPKHRGALQFTRARLVHVSPVTDPSIPGTATVGVRSDTEPQEDPMDQAVLDALTALPDAIRTAVTEGLRDAGMTGAADDGDTDATPEDLAAAVDAALDAATAICERADTTGWTPEAQQVCALVRAAGVASDELLEAMGVDDPDDDDAMDAMRSAGIDVDALDEGERASGKKPYGDVAYADPGYQEDKQKRYPIDTAAHVKAALSYIGQEDNAAKYSAEDLAKVKKNIAAAAKKFGIDAGGRSAEDEDTRAAEDAAAFEAERQRALDRLAARGIA